MSTPNSVTLADLITRARRRADQENSTFCTDAEIVDAINVGVATIHNELVSLYEDYFVTKSSALTLTSSVSSFDLPSDFYKALGVDFDDSGTTVRVRRFNFSERNNLQSAYQRLGSGRHLMYSVQGNKIYFIPNDGSVTGDAFLWYVPMAESWTSSETSVTLSSRIPQIARGWEEYIVLSAAIYMMLKEEADVQILLAEREYVMEKIRRQGEPRDEGEPRQIARDENGTLDYRYSRLRY